MFAARNSFLAGSASAPSAPTIGTATVVSSTSVSVAFTPPTNTGGSPITSYTVTSSPGSITASGASSPITVTGLSSGTAYTFTVTATNAVGTSPASSASNSVTTTPVIGQSFGGGYYAGSISTTANGVATHYLIVSPAASGQKSPGAWKTSQTNAPGTDSLINGPANSAAMNDPAYPAAYFCEGLTIGGYTDWYLPAKNELEVLYYYFKPKTDGNKTTSGSNANAVSPEPISTNYTASSPARTSITAFRDGGSECIGNSSLVWSSTQQSTQWAFVQYFADGDQITQLKDQTTCWTRAVRRVPV